ncbi:hypothetical protein M3638_01260 [Oceanobacillus profundus]|uniref:hypothetical protein n=1 Tax=Oceanobacillus profundus TaxID=372463 RepID=UPI00203B7473|nr:hypothetical protein [Oceanobacillus profundus]MCM3396462.1 hypothetical protein [Oceanobacillus profundus]
MNETKFWKYYVPSVDGVEGWGIFLLDSTGMFSCVTDYGNYAFNWVNHGMDDFREFFARDTGFDYHVNKLYRIGCEAQLEFQPDETVKLVKQSILESRWEDHMSKETARSEWDLLDEIDWTNGLLSQNEWYERTDLCDAYEFFVYDYPPRVKALRDKLFPRFAKMLREELEKEKVS